VAYPLRSAAASAAYWMKPFQPPLPTIWNLPFQPESGSQVSDLISESLDGLIVNSTRQKAGRSANPSAAPAGGWKAPALTTFAVIVVLGSTSSEIPVCTSEGVVDVSRAHASASAACAAGGASALTLPAT